MDQEQGKRPPPPPLHVCCVLIDAHVKPSSLPAHSFKTYFQIYFYKRNKNKVYIFIQKNTKHNWNST